MSILQLQLELLKKTVDFTSISFDDRYIQLFF